VRCKLQNKSDLNKIRSVLRKNWEILVKKILSCVGLYIVVSGCAHQLMRHRLCPSTEWKWEQMISLPQSEVRRSGWIVITWVKNLQTLVELKLM
jgi:hypothetical protein